MVTSSPGGFAATGDHHSTDPLPLGGVQVVPDVVSVVVPTVNVAACAVLAKLTIAIATTIANPTCV